MQVHEVTMNNAACDGPNDGLILASKDMEEVWNAKRRQGQEA